MNLIKNKNIYFIFSIVKNYPFYMLSFLFITTAWAVDMSLRPYLLKIIVNSLIIANDSYTIITWASCYIISNLVVTFFSYVHETLSLEAAPSIKKHTLSLLMNKIITQPWDPSIKIPVGALNNKLNEVVDGITKLFQCGLDKIFGGILALIIANFAIWSVDMIFGIVVTCWIVLYILLFSGHFNRLKVLSKVVSNGKSKIAAFIIDVLSNLKLVLLSSTREHEINLLTSIYTKYIRNEKKLTKYIRNLNTTQGLFIACLQGLCLIFMIIRLSDHSITPGDFVLILTLNNAIAICAKNLAQYWQDFLQTFGIVTEGLNSLLIEKCSETLSKETSLLLDNCNQKLYRKVTHPLINIKNIAFKYANSTTQLCIGKLIINSGEKIALVGFSGSGKSTFASILAGMINSQNSSIELKGKKTSHMTRDEFNDIITLIPQDQIIFNRTIRDNIIYGHEGISDKEMLEASKRGLTHDFIMSLPQKYSQLIGERGSRLSGGEIQRLTITRAFLSNAPLLILDEATNQLDALNEKKLVLNLLSHCQKKSIVFITHKLHNVINFKRILLMKEGTLVGDGTHQELLKANSDYQVLWQSQMGLEHTVERFEKVG